MIRAKRNIAYLLSMTLILTSLPTRIFAQEGSTIPNSSTLLNNVESTTSSSLELETTTPGALEIIPNKYVGDGYEVEFKVTNRWPGGFNGEFIVTNTGEKDIENWTLQYEFEHKITNIWNAKIITHENNTYIIKNEGYNQDIAVGNSITIGFQGLYEKEIKAPRKYDLLVVEKEASNEDYTVIYKLINDWGQGYNAEISITNNGDEPIEDWSLEFDFDTKIDRFYTAEILEYEGDHYVIKNLGYNANIKPGETINLGFEGKPGNVDNKPINYVLTQLAQIEDIDHKKDTDSDGIPDFFEKIIGTDINSIDTDEDGLPDGYEYYYLITDPILKDTDNNQVMDGEEDFDEDGLGNLDEYTNRTDPFVNDTDEDGLIDGDEVHKYKTNPLIVDTDGDTLCDSEEINIGLDPNHMYTYDVVDSEYIFNQSITSEMITNIKQDSFKVSVELEAAGDATAFFDVRDSYHASVLGGNDAILGEPIELSYERKVQNMRLMFEPSQTYIDMEQGIYIDDEGLKGIKRYQIFRYNEKYNTLSPVMTDFDTETNQVYTESNELGTYCLIDLEKWFYNLGIDSSDVTQENPLLEEQLANAPNNITMLSDSVPLTFNDTEVTKSVVLQNDTKANVNTPIELVFIVDVTGSMGSKIKPIKNNIKSLVTSLYSEGIKAKVGAVAYNNYYSYNGKLSFDTVLKQVTYGDGNTVIIKNDWATNPEEAEELIDQVVELGGGDEPYVDGICVALNDLEFSPGEMKFFVIITDEVGCMQNRGTTTGNNPGIFTTASEVARELDQREIITSVVTTPSLFTHNNYLPIYTETNGIATSISGDYCTDIKNLILESVKNSKQFTIVNPASMKSITLKQYPVKGTSVNSDTDELTDSEEIDWDMVESYWDYDMLPTLGEYLNELDKKYGDVFERISEKYQHKLNSVVVLPIKSDPSADDSDGDGILDHNENEKDRMIYNYLELDVNSNEKVVIGKDEYCILKINNLSTCVYDMYTISDIDTYGELFYKKIGGKLERLQVNDNWGDGNNTKITAYLKSYKEYYLKIINNSSSSASVNIRLEEHLDKMICEKGGAWIPEGETSYAGSFNNKVVYLPAEAVQDLYDTVANDEYKKLYALGVQAGTAVLLAYMMNEATSEVVQMAQKLGLPSKYKKLTSSGINLIGSALVMRVPPDILALELESIVRESNTFRNGVKITSMTVPSAGLNGGINYHMINVYSSWNGNVMEGISGQTGRFDLNDYTPTWR